MLNIGPGQKTALLQAYDATVALLSASLRPEFLVIGGTSLILIGSHRKTEDLDFAVTAAALLAFEEASRDDIRFSKGALADWTYSCETKGIEDLKVSLDFLQIGGCSVPHIKCIKQERGGFRPSLGELARIKANAYMARDTMHDFEDCLFLLRIPKKDFRR